MVSEFDNNKFDTSTNTSEDEKEEEEEKDVVRALKEEDKMSSVTCYSCQSRQAVSVSGSKARPERERFVSRMV